ncbi:hypothetical protein DCC62_31025, partial [candidate division KSB1 bacterium]
WLFNRFCWLLLAACNRHLTKQGCKKQQSQCFVFICVHGRFEFFGCKIKLAATIAAAAKID